MNTKALRQKILDLAIRGKLVPQNPNDEPASVLLDRIRAEKERLVKEGKIKRPKKNATSDTHHYENVPFEVPEGWVWCKIDDIGEVVTGSTPSKDIKEYYGNDFPFFKPTDLEQGEFTKEASDGLTNAGIKVARKLPSKSVLVTCIGATIGKTGLTQCEGATNQQINAIIPFSIILPEYLYFTCISDYMQKEIKENASATTLPILNKNNFAALFIPLPPLTEQTLIVDEVKKWMSIVDDIESSKTDLQQLIAQAKSKILDLAIRGKLVEQDKNDEPASELLKRINPDWQPSDTSHYENVPQGWCECLLEDVVDYEQPQTYIVNSTDYSEEYPTPVLTAGKSFIIGYTNESTGIVEDLPVIIFDDFTTDSKYVDFPFKVKSSAIKILHVKKGLNPLYVSMFMSITRLTGDTHKRYWISEYSKIHILLPPAAEQERIVSCVNNLFVQLDSISQALAD